jgi:cell wall-associated NlpC family hydrolase
MIGTISKRAKRKHVYRRHLDPDRIEVVGANNRSLATFTMGAFTVVLAGPRRRFSEGDASVAHAKWVRTYPAPFDGEVDPDWLQEALAANEARVPDVLVIAMQYIRGAPALEEGGLQIAGDARYGPGTEDRRREGSDFNDYLGVTWQYSGEPEDQPEPSQFRCLDCSGYMRMIWGYRHHLRGRGYDDTVPLSFAPTPDHSTIPRRSHQIYKSAPGIIIIPRRKHIMDFSPLDVGDLVFFDADVKDGSKIDHVGMYLGRDSHRRRRFISSRKKRNGPTLGDYKGASVLDGKGLYARSFCAARRI